MPVAIRLTTNPPAGLREASFASKCRLVLLCIGFAIGVSGNTFAEDSADDLFRAGKYDAAMEFAKIEVDRGVWNEKWPKLLIRCQLARGNYAEALAVYHQAIGRYSQSLSLRMLGREVLLANNQTEQAEREADQVFSILQQSSSRFASADSLVAAGRYFVLRNEDARQVLTLFYDRVRQADPKHLDAHLATAELAISKGDFLVASQTLATAEGIDERDPRVGFLQAHAWESSDSEKATKAIQKSLQCNPNFTPSLLMLVDNAISAERYSDAEKTITRVLEINPNEWAAWSYLAVIAHLRGQYEIEPLMRAAALSNWSKNPGVDHLIGRKLSDSYRFEEGASYQRRSLAFQTDFAPAQFQLAQDLLRLGEDAIGWEIAGEVSKADPYNVVVHNLMTLSDRLKTFTKLESEGIEVRMDSAEAAIYGNRVVDLLVDAKNVLCEKFDVVPRAPIIVEIYPQQKDFAIRTFGLPGGAGFLGVCFGRVITANSPASQGSRPSNWESVLWHEFCHAVTLDKTKNRMPRWLSEGISVYEERQRNASWGQSMTPVFREMLLDEALTPVSRLSGAFLKPPTPTHLQFAYFQSSLVVEFLVDRFGMDSLNSLLVELGNGLSINDAISRSMRPIESIDEQFSIFAKETALEFGKEANWDREDDSVASVWKLIENGTAAVVAKEWDDAKDSFEKLKELEVVYPERDGPLEQLATAYRELGDTEKEVETLEMIDKNSSDSLDSLTRLIEISRAKKDWEEVLRYANKWVAIQPLLPTGYEAIAEAADELNKPLDVANSLLAISELKPVDPADVDLRLAQAQLRLGQMELAKRSVLRALEIAPRYREAHQLLLQILEEANKEVVEPTPKETEP